MNKSDLKIVFFGTPDFAVESLKRLHEEGYNIVGVVTMPDKPAGRGHYLQQSDVKKYAVEQGMNLLQPENLKDENFIADLRRLDAQLFIVIAFRMLPQVVWQMPPLGTFNLHASLLPKYRGAAPINWAVMNGDTETGVTTFFLKHEIDTGDVIQQRKISIARNDNVETVHDRLMIRGAEMVLDTVNGIIAGTVQRTPQEQLISGDIQPTPAPKIFKETCRINWSWTAERIYNHIRGLSPYPAAWTELVAADGKRVSLKVFESLEPVYGNISAGTIVSDGKRLMVGCADGKIELTSVQLAGKKRMTTAEFLRGFHVDGAHFE